MIRTGLVIGVALQAAAGFSLSENANNGQKNLVATNNVDSHGQQVQAHGVQAAMQQGAMQQGVMQQGAVPAASMQRAENGPSRQGGQGNGPSPTWTSNDEKRLQGHEEYRSNDVINRQREINDKYNNNNNNNQQRGNIAYDSYRFLSEVDPNVGGANPSSVNVGGGKPSSVGNVAEDNSYPSNQGYTAEGSNVVHSQGYDSDDSSFPTYGFNLMGFTGAEVPVYFNAYGNEWTGPMMNTGGYYGRDMISASNMIGGGNVASSQRYHGEGMQGVGMQGVGMQGVGMQGVGGYRQGGVMSGPYRSVSSGFGAYGPDAPIRRLDSWREEEEEERERMRRRRHEMEMNDFGRYGAGNMMTGGRPIGAGFDRDRRGERWGHEGGYREGGYYQGGNRYGGNENRYRTGGGMGGGIGGIGGGLSSLVNEIF